MMRKVFSPNTRANGRPTAPPSCDAAPARLIDGTLLKLRDDLVRVPGDKEVGPGIVDLVTYAADASPYRLVPQAQLN
jgi:D-lactate dehydrogenase